MENTMPKKITAAAVPKLQLTAQDEKELRQLGAELRREILTQYEEFVFQSKRGVDASRWKYVRSDGDVHAYKERKPKAKPVMDDKHMYAYPYGKSSGPQKRLADQSPLPRVLVTGTLPGTLDDIMFGSAYHDTQSFQANWASLGNFMEESAVLAMMEGPSLDDPYRHLGVSWFLRTFPLNLRSHRDCLVLDDTRLAKLSNGERVGVMVGHSIQHRDLTELREFKTIRATTSMLTVYRQLDPQRVEVFTIHFLDTKGCVPESSHAQESIKHNLPSASIMMGLGLRKKLHWSMRRREHERLASTPCDAIEPMSSGSNETCELCDKTIGSLFSCPGTSCHLCYQRVCSKCCVSQDLAVSVSANKTVLKPFDFCIACVLRAKATSSLTVAQEQVVHHFDSGNKRERVLTTLMSADDVLYYS